MGKYTNFFNRIIPRTETTSSSYKPDVKMEKLKKISEIVKVCNDFYLGHLKVFDDSYLPKMDRETEEGYKLRKMSTTFTNFFAPIATGLTGLITKKEPVMTNLDKLPIDDIDDNGNSLTNFIKDVCTASIVSGIEFVSIETSWGPAGARVFLNRYSYENLYSYKLGPDGSFSQIVFKDIVEVEKGMFEVENRERYIVFQVYGGSIWYANSKGVFEEQARWENYVEFIPVVPIITGKEITKLECVPRLYDIAKMNHVLFNLESQLANILNVVANPVPMFFGKLQEGEVTVGSREALAFLNKQEQGFEYAEITGNGVDKLQKKIKETEDNIDKLSFSLLQKEDSRTVIDAQENQSRSSSFLGTVAEELESKFNIILRMMAIVDNSQLPDDAGLEFEKNFDDVLLSDQQTKVMYEMVRSGDLSRETLWERLKSQNFLPKDFDADVEKEKLESQPV